MPTDQPPLTIIKFEASNVKRLRAVQIDDCGNFVVISGRNGQGKSSILDSIMWALGGARTMNGTDRPIRDGAKKASVSLDLGEYQVTRTFTPSGGGELTVTTKDGARVASPQALLDGMLGRHSFDPWAFVRLRPKEQVATLLQVVDLGLNLEQLALDRDSYYQQRLEIGRRRDKLRAQLDMMTRPGDDTPFEEVAATDVIDELRAARLILDENKALGAAVLDVEGDLELMDDRIADLEVQLETARKARRQLAARLKEALKDRADRQPDPDIANIEQRLADLDAVNRQVRAAGAYDALTAALTAALDDYQAHTASIDDIDERKAVALAATNMPIDGLTFDEDGLSFVPRPGEPAIPLSQCSSSEQLRVSVAIAVALNPRIRIARVQEGSLLDHGSLRLLAALADQHGFQLWVEMVDATGKVGVVIEDGQVVARNPVLEGTDQL